MDENNSNKSTVAISNFSQIQNDLLELVQKNKLIPDFLNNLLPNDPKLLGLKRVIDEGDSRAEIWNDSNCNLYLIYLIREELIPFWQGITAYVYLIAKMQYTQTQELRAEDQDIKFNYDTQIVLLVESGRITELGYQYLLSVTQALEKLKIYLNFAYLEDFVLKLPPIEQWLIKTEYAYYGKESANHLIWVLINNLPLLGEIASDNLDHYDGKIKPYLVPSSSMIHYFLQVLNKQPMDMRPVLGNPGLETLYRWHAQDFHPVSLYATQILSNPKKADGFRCGPFPMWLHDIGHTFWASMLSKSQRDSIFTNYIPALHYLKEWAKKFDDSLSLELINEAERKAYDFDLTPILDYADVEKRFDIYLAHTIGKNPIYPSCVYTGFYEHAKIGQAEGDTFYFLLHYALYLDKTPDAYKEIYQTLIGFITTGPTYREQRIVNVLKTVAKNAAADPQALFASDPFPVWKGDSVYWQTLFKSDQSSKALWSEITSDADLAEELLKMMEKGLIFFHPYLPMTATKRWAMLFYLENQLTFGAKSSYAQCSNDTIKAKSAAPLSSLDENNSHVYCSTQTNRTSSQGVGFWQDPAKTYPQEYVDSVDGACNKSIK